MKFEEVQDARDEVSAAQAKLVEVETAYLKDNGYEFLVDVASETAGWRHINSTAANTDPKSFLPRSIALGCIQAGKHFERHRALEQIESLKAKHDLDNVVVLDSKKT